MGSTRASALAGAAGAAVGFLVGRTVRRNPLRKILNGNDRLLTRDECRLVAALCNQGMSHLFKAWPAPGVRDEEKRALVRALCSSLAGGTAGLEPARLAVLQPPVAAKRPKVLEAHNDLRTDEYYWLRDDARKDRDVINYLDEENKYTRAVMADTEALQETLYKEMRGRIKEEDQSVPTRFHGWYYYTRTREGQQYRVHCRRRVPQGAGPPSEKDAMSEAEAEEIMLDENARKEQGGHSFYMVGCCEPSPDHTLLAWSEDTVGGERYTLHVKELGSGREVTSVPETSGEVVWAADNKTLFYVVKDHLDRPYKVFRHAIGTPASSDAVVYEEKDEAFYVGIGKSRSEEVIFISCGSAVTSEARYIRADRPTDEFKVVLPRVTDMEYGVEHRGSHFYIKLRDAGRPNSELVVAPMDSPDAMRTLLPHSKDVKLESVELARDFLVLFVRSGGLQRALVHRLSGSEPPASLAGLGKEINFPEPAYELGPGSQGDFDSPVLRLLYTSLATPTSTIDHNMASGQQEVKKVQPVLGGFSQKDYVTQRLWASAKDGVKVPISLVYKKGAVKLDGSDPLLLNGYGSYEVSNDPYFSANRLCLLDRGFIFAVAHIRGGGEMGRAWYEDGKYLKKWNTFIDFIACAEHLVAQKYTTPAKLSIEGRSAGGLLMGAVLNTRPDLFNSAIMGVPFVDVLTTIQDETIPLTVIEWEEWGDPRKPEFYSYLKSYSPVDNIRPAAYPHILATGGLHDPRVGYWEPAKFVAKLRATKTDSRLLLLKTEMGAGHFSVTGRFERLREIAFEYAFLLKAQGLLSAVRV